MTEQENAVEHPPIEELLAKIQCSELDTLVQLFPELSFEDSLQEQPHLADFLQKQIQMKFQLRVDWLRQCLEKY